MHILSDHVVFILPGYGGKKGSVQTCGNCRGSGMQIRIHQIAPGMVQQIQSMCAECKGEGESISAKDRCKNCNGKKTIREKKIIEVHIDKGAFISEVHIDNNVCVCVCVCVRLVGWILFC